MRAIATPGAGSPAVTLNGHDVSAAFHAAAGGGPVTGLVTNLVVGENVLTVAGKDFKPMAGTTAIPADAATTTRTAAGRCRSCCA